MFGEVEGATEIKSQVANLTANEDDMITEVEFPWGHSSLVSRDDVRSN